MSDFTPSGPCASWATLDDLPEGCPCRVVESGGESPTDDQLEELLAEATDVVWALLGRPAFGVCEITIYPCARDEFRRGASILGHTQFGLTGCGDCEGHERDVWLDGPVHDVIEVIVDGTTLDPSEYRLEDEFWLVRVGGSWPAGGIDDDGFVITYERGDEVPYLVRDAVIELVPDLWRDRCDGGQRIPNAVQSMNTQGTSYSYDTNQPKLPMTWKAKSTFNPTSQHMQPYVYSPDRGYRPRTVRTFS